ncbi:TPA: MFS transporter, partial [Escherichia albertii]|nr:MFS transporter [Escherichia albertii]
GGCGYTGQLIFNIFIGVFVAAIGFSTFFVILAFLDIIGAIILWSVIKPPKLIEQPNMATQ